MKARHFQNKVMVREKTPALASRVPGTRSSQHSRYSRLRAGGATEPQSHKPRGADVPKTITQRELRNDSGRILRELDRGESFVVTRKGVVVGQLVPVQRSPFVTASELRGAFANAPRIDLEALRRDVDRFLDQRPHPRA
jgi:antitoxin (DNA-binding transcriptional repressor) of toxin-antitoxin stability system